MTTFISSDHHTTGRPAQGQLLEMKAGSFIPHPSSLSLMLKKAPGAVVTAAPEEVGGLPCLFEQRARTV
jgi:hypothetical protein